MVKIKAKKVSRALKKSTRPKRLAKTAVGLVKNPVKTITSPLGPKNEALARATIGVIAPLVEASLDAKTGGEFSKRKAVFENNRMKAKSGLAAIAEQQKIEREKARKN